MDVRVVGKQTFLRSMEEVCAVIDGSLFTRRATKDLWLPGVTIVTSVVARNQLLTLRLTDGYRNE